MKFLPAFIFLFLLFIGCGDKKDDVPADEKDELAIDTTDIVTTPVEKPDENFLVRYKFQPGKEYNYKVATLTENIQTVTQDTTITSKINQSVVYIISIKPVRIDEDSTLEVTCTFKSVKVEAEGNGQKFSFQSSDKIDSTEMITYGEYIILLNNPFTFRVNKTGEILEVFRTDKILSSFMDLRGAGQTITQEQRNMIKDQIVEAGIKPLLMQIFRRIPGEYVAKDSVWTIQMPESHLAIFKAQNKSKYSVIGLEKYDDDKVAVFDASLETKITGDSKLIEQGVTYNFKKPTSEASGKIYFNLSKGCVIKSQVKNKIVISYTMEADLPQGKQKRSQYESMVLTNIVELL